MKHVEFHSKNKFEKLVHLIDFILRNEIMYFIVMCYANDLAQRMNKVINRFSKKFIKYIVSRYKVSNSLI